MKHIVCPGIAKCGTSSLNQLLVHHAPAVATPLGGKEIQFFSPEIFRHSASYVGQFQMKEASLVTFEASPQYLSGQGTDEIKATFKHLVQSLDDFLIVVLLRAPVQRAYSHYLHNLHPFAMFGQGGWSQSSDADFVKKPYGYSFSDSLDREPQIRMSYAERLGNLLAMAPRERVLVGTMKHDLHTEGSFIRKIFDFIGCSPPAPFPFPRSNERRPLPRYLVTGERAHSFPFKGGELLVPRSTLVCISAEHGIRIVRKITPEIGMRFQSCQENWTRRLSRDSQASLYNVAFREDTERLADLLGNLLSQEQYAELTADPTTDLAALEWDPPEEEIEKIRSRLAAAISMTSR